MKLYDERCYSWSRWTAIYDKVDVDVDGDHGNKFEGKDIRGRTIQHDDKKEPPAKRAKHSTIESHLAFWDTHYTSLFTRTLRALRIMP